MQEQAAWAFKNLAMVGVNQVKIAAAGAIPPLVALLGAQSTAAVQEQAALALHNLTINWVATVCGLGRNGEDAGLPLA